jgi:hypothetical protein
MHILQKVIYIRYISNKFIDNLIGYYGSNTV